MSNSTTPPDERIKLPITYKGKTVWFSANPVSALRTTLVNLQKLANTYPDKFWELPEMDNGGNRIVYYLGIEKEGKKILLQYTDNKGDELSLNSYGVQGGDTLFLIQKQIAG